MTPAILMLLAGLLLVFRPARALAMLRVNYSGPVMPSVWYRVGGGLMLLMAIVLFITMFVSE